MTFLFTIVGVIATVLLLASGASVMARANAVDPNRRGGWDVLQWPGQTERPLDPQQRRWQTQLIAGQGNRARWPETVTEIRRLEHLSGATPIEPAPASYNRGWIDDSISNLEANIERRSVTGETA